MSSKPTPDYITLQEAAGRLPKGRNGKPVYASTITRWIVFGVRITGGRRVMLRGVRMPNGWRTTAAWVDEFLDTLTRASIEEANRAKVSVEPDAIRDFEVEMAMKELTARGL